MTADEVNQALAVLLRFPGEVLTRLSNIEQQNQQILERFNAMDERLTVVTKGVNRVIGQNLRDITRDRAMSKSLEELQNAVQANNDATASAVELIQGLAGQLRDAVGDDAAVQELADRIESQAAALAKAVTENTPFTPSGNEGETGSDDEDEGDFTPSGN